MSDNLKCSTPDFSKYDSMSIEELEEILRADAMGPEREDSDVDEILYVMEVLAKKRRKNGIAGKTVLEAYQEFQQHYLPLLEEDPESVPRRKAKCIPFRRIAAIAASLVLVFALTSSANALGWKEIWNAMAKWAQETFCFSTGVEVSEPHSDFGIEYDSIQVALTEAEMNIQFTPTWVPERYELAHIRFEETPVQKTVIALYENGEDSLKISIKTLVADNPEQLEVSGKLLELYTVNGIDFYIMQNNNLMQATWISENCECYIAGQLTIDEIKEMIDSIEKG